ncbi:MAG: 6-bladed beta-propeller [Candidatus Aminicenantales bacterium]
MIKGELLFTLGSDEENESFYDPEEFVVDGKEGVYLLDKKNGRVQHFSPDGKFIRSFGGIGQGPGEMSQAPTRIRLLEDGNLYVLDRGSARILMFSRQGEFLKSWPARASYDDIALSGGVYYLSNLLLTENHQPIHFGTRLDKIDGSFGIMYEPVVDIFKVLKKLGIRLTSRFVGEQMTSVLPDAGGAIIYAQKYPYRFARYRKDHSLAADVAGDVGYDTHYPLVFDKRDVGIMLSLKLPFSIASPPQLLKGNRLMFPFLSRGRSILYLDIYDSNNVRVSRYGLPMTFIKNIKNSGIRCLHLDDADNLYCLVVSAEEIPKLYKFKLFFD